MLDAARSLLPTPFLDIVSRVDSTEGEQGLLGLAFHPDYAQNGWFYVYYIVDGGLALDRSRVSRFSVSSTDPDLADASSEVVLLEFEQPFANHNAGDIHFGPDGYLYIASGDGGDGAGANNVAADPTTLLGKLLRIDVDARPGESRSGLRPQRWELRDPSRQRLRRRRDGKRLRRDLGEGPPKSLAFPLRSADRRHLDRRRRRGRLRGDRLRSGERRSGPRLRLAMLRGQRRLRSERLPERRPVLPHPHRGPQPGRLLDHRRRCLPRHSVPAPPRPLLLLRLLQRRAPHDHSRCERNARRGGRSGGRDEPALHPSEKTSTGSSTWRA